jgi:hypothetical protein
MREFQQEIGKLEKEGMTQIKRWKLHSNNDGSEEHAQLFPLIVATNF